MLTRSVVEYHLAVAEAQLPRNDASNKAHGQLVDALKDSNASQKSVVRAINGLHKAVNDAGVQWDLDAPRAVELLATRSRDPATDPVLRDHVKLGERLFRLTLHAVSMADNHARAVHPARKRRQSIDPRRGQPAHRHLHVTAIVLGGGEGGLRQDGGNSRGQWRGPFGIPQRL